jgi:hypothetical protein
MLRKVALAWRIVSKKPSQQKAAARREAERDRDHWSRVQANARDAHTEHNAARAVNDAQSRIDKNR